MGRLSGWVIVTGAAGAIGGATARRFLQRGCAVLGMDLVHNDGLPLATPDSGPYRHALVDVNDLAAIDRAVTLAEIAFGAPPAHLASIAGGAVSGEVASGSDPRNVSVDLFRTSLEQNLVSHYGVLRVALRHMEETTAEDRSITFCSSFAAFTGLGLPGYSAAKGGLAALTHALAPVLGSRGVRINAVAPGTVLTPRNQKQWDPERFEELRRRSPLGRLGIADDVGAAFAAVALELRHLTGQVIVLDGGQSLVVEPSETIAAARSTGSFPVTPRRPSALGQSRNFGVS